MDSSLALGGSYPFNPMRPMTTILFLRYAATVGLGLMTSGIGFAQVVAVTLSLDDAQVPVGGTTTLKVYAQVVLGQRAASERIFSWYVDLLNSNGQVAGANYEALLKAAADNLANTSSTGFTQGANRQGIYDTFIEDTPVSKTGIGVGSPVLLLTVPITGLAGGRTTFSVRAGTGVQGLSKDFIVAPKGGGDPLTGGDYRAASVELEVSSGPQMAIASAPLPGGLARITATFPTTAGVNHVVEYRDQLGAGPGWQPLPGAPHNSGRVTDTNTVPQRFYRVKVTD